MRPDTASICFGGGLLVGPRLEVPDAPHASLSMQATVASGCNQLECSLCSTAVRQRAGWSPAKLGGPEVSAAIYADTDWSRSKNVAAAPKTRLYSCRCTTVTIDDDKSFRMPNRVWSCAGHPSASGGPGGMLVLADENVRVMFSPNIPYLRVDLSGTLALDAFQQAVENKFVLGLVAAKNRPNVVLNGASLTKIGTDQVQWLGSTWSKKAAAGGIKRCSFVALWGQNFPIMKPVFDAWGTDAARVNGLDLRFFPIEQFQDTWESVSWFEG
jgi:hypothetical protein